MESGGGHWPGSMIPATGLDQSDHDVTHPHQDAPPPCRPTSPPPTPSPRDDDDDAVHPLSRDDLHSRSHDDVTIIMSPTMYSCCQMISARRLATHPTLPDDDLTRDVPHPATRPLQLTSTATILPQRRRRRLWTMETSPHPPTC